MNSGALAEDALINGGEDFPDVPGEKKMKALLLKEARTINGEVIEKIAGSRYYVSGRAKIEDVASDMLADPSVQNVAVLDETGRSRGIIKREDLLGTLSKPFGRELFTSKTADTVMISVPEFNRARNLFSVAAEISGDLEIGKKRCYLLVDDAMKFSGIFTNDDMLMYLSEMTRRDIALANKLQSFIVRDEMDLSTNRCRILGACRMAKGVGGDYYSIRSKGNGCHMLALCDVSGKGISASLLTVLLDSTLGGFDTARGIDEYVMSLNNYVMNTFNMEKYITGIFAEFNEETGITVVLDMGHSYCYMLRNGRFIKLNMKHRGMPIGVDRECSPRGNIVQLRKGDILMFFTDGIEEQKNPDGEEYGIVKTVPIVKKFAGDGLKAVKDRIMDDVTRFRGNLTQQDDISMLMLEYFG